MPVLEAIVSNVLPKPVEIPIPTRTVNTRGPKAPPAESIRDQADTLRDKVVGADSSTTAESVRLSPQLSALARKEQAFRQREQALKDREKEIDAKLADAERFAQLKAKTGAKDFSEAEALGLDYEGYTNYLLAKQNGEKPEVQAFKKLEDKIAAMAQREEESKTAQYESTVAEYRTEIASFVESKPEFAGLKSPEHQKAVLQVILDAFEKDDEELSIEQAAQDVKAFLMAQAKELEIFLEKKVEEPLAEERKTLPPPSKSGLKTLTQQVTTGASAVPLKSLQHMSEQERYAEARRRAVAKLEANNKG